MAQVEMISPLDTGAGLVAPKAPGSPLKTPETAGLIADFLAYLELERGLSRNTLEAYRSDLLQFSAFLKRRDLAVRDAQHSDLAAFIGELAEGADGRALPAATTLGRKV